MIRISHNVVAIVSMDTVGGLIYEQRYPHTNWYPGLGTKMLPKFTEPTTHVREAALLCKGLLLCFLCIAAVMTLAAPPQLSWLHSIFGSLPHHHKWLRTTAVHLPHILSTSNSPNPFSYPTYPPSCPFSSHNQFHYLSWIRLSHTVSQGPTYAIFSWFPLNSQPIQSIPIHCLLPESLSIE